MTYFYVMNICNKQFSKIVKKWHLSSVKIYLQFWNSHSSIFTYSLVWKVDLYNLLYKLGFWTVFPGRDRRRVLYLKCINIVIILIWVMWSWLKVWLKDTNLSLSYSKMLQGLNEKKIISISQAKKTPKK